MAVKSVDDMLGPQMKISFFEALFFGAPPSPNPILFSYYINIKTSEEKIEIDMLKVIFFIEDQHGAKVLRCKPHTTNRQDFHYLQMLVQIERNDWVRFAWLSRDIVNISDSSRLLDRSKSYF